MRKIIHICLILVALLGAACSQVKEPNSPQGKMGDDRKGVEIVVDSTEVNDTIALD